MKIKFRYNSDFCLCVKIDKMWNQHDACKFCKFCMGRIFTHVFNVISKISNFLTLKEFFTKYFLRPWNPYFQKKKKKKFNYFHKLWTSFCVYKRIKVFFVLDMTVKYHWEFVEFGGKVKQYTRIGSSSLLLPRNNTQRHGIELVLMWNVKVLRNLLKLIIALTVVLFSTRILTFWPWICYEAWRLVTKMSWNHVVASSLG